MATVLAELIRTSTVPEWTGILREIQRTYQPRHESRLIEQLRALHDRLHTSDVLVDYARSTVSRLVMRQIASETQEMIIKDVLSGRKDKLPTGAAVLDNLESLPKRVKLTAAEKKRLEANIVALGLGEREFTLFRLFRETAREIAHPELADLPHEAINRTALDSVRDGPPELESFGKEVLEKYWQTLRYFSDVHSNKTRKNVHRESVGTANKSKIDRESLRRELASLPTPEFAKVVESVYQLARHEQTSEPRNQQKSEQQKQQPQMQKQSGQQNQQKKRNRQTQKQSGQQKRKQKTHRRHKHKKT